MWIAAFGDVHGNLDGMYEMCRAWEERKGLRISLVVQCGDMGIWRDPAALDKASRKHFDRDPTELGARPYILGEKESPIETWFVHGNHEDFAFLAEHENGFLDPAGRIFFLGPGSVNQFTQGDETILIAGLGGMEYRFGKAPPPSSERVQKYIHPPSLDKLAKTAPRADLLLLHDAPLNKGLKDRFPTGSSRIDSLVRSLSPKLMLYGHYNNPPPPFQTGATLCACLNMPSAAMVPRRDGAMGIIGTESWSFEYVRPEDFV